MLTISAPSLCLKNIVHGGNATTIIQYWFHLIHINNMISACTAGSHVNGPKTAEEGDDEEKKNSKMPYRIEFGCHL